MRRSFIHSFIHSFILVAMVVTTSVVSTSLKGPQAPSYGSERVRIVHGGLEIQHKVEEFASDIQETAEQFESVSDGRETATLKSFKRLVQSGTIVLHIDSQSRLDISSAVVKRLGEDRWVATVPVRGNVAEPSNVTAVFDTTATMVSFSETLLAPQDANSGRLSVWHDGDLAFDRMGDSFGNTWAPTEEPPSESTEQITLSSSVWTHFNKCLNNQGVAQWAINLLAIACGVVCVGTAGAGCVPCLIAVGTVASFTIGYCMGRARQHKNS